MGSSFIQGGGSVPPASIQTGGRVDISEQSLLSARLENCKCSGGKDTKCDCTDKHGKTGCCRFNSCYPNESCSSSSFIQGGGSAPPASIQTGGRVDISEQFFGLIEEPKKKKEKQAKELHHHKEQNKAGLI